MFTNNKRIIHLLIISVIMNLGLFAVCYYLNLPLWLDTTGTVYISCILGAPIGFLVAIINNASQAMFFYGKQAIFFYFVSLLTAYTAGFTFRKYKGSKIKKWIVMTLLLLILEGVSAVLITFSANGGIPSNYWSNRIYYSLLSVGHSPIVSTVISVLTIKIPDVIVSTAIVAAAIRLTPRRYKTTDTIILQSVEEHR